MQIATLGRIKVFVAREVKSIDTSSESWKALADQCLVRHEAFQLVGFDLAIPEHKAFWQKVREGAEYRLKLELGANGSLTLETADRSR